MNCRKVISDHRRRRCEITPDAKVTIENVAGRPFAFSLIPCKGQQRYLLEGYSLQQRVVVRFIFSFKGYMGSFPHSGSTPDTSYL